MPKVTLPIRGPYYFQKDYGTKTYNVVLTPEFAISSTEDSDTKTYDVTLKSKYIIPHTVEVLVNPFYTDAGDQLLGVATYPADAEIVGFLAANPISMGANISSAEIELLIDGGSSTKELGLNICSNSVFQRVVNSAKFSFGIGIEGANAALVRKTILADFDNNALANIDGKSLYDLTYITIE